MQKRVVSRLMTDFDESHDDAACKRRTRTARNARESGARGGAGVWRALRAFSLVQCPASEAT